MTLRVYGHLFPGRQEELTGKLDAIRAQAIAATGRPNEVVDLAPRRHASGT